MGFIKLEDDMHCFVCGCKNKYGLHLEFSVDENNVMHTEFIPEKHHQGFKDIVHGGLIGLILDEIMLNLAWRLGRNAVTVDLNIRLKKIANIGEKLLFRGWIDREENKVIYTKSEAINGQGRVIATGSAKCLRV